jgi:hypothetical protein
MAIVCKLICLFFLDRKPLLAIKCKQGRYFLVDGNPEEVKFKNLVCEKKIVADVVAKGKCKGELSTAGELSSIGFTISQHEHLTYFTTCVDMQNKNVLWTEHKLHSFDAEGLCEFSASSCKNNYN